jgi:hypothetical protein
MSDKPKYPVVQILFLAAVISIMAAMGAFRPIIVPIQEKMDDHRLAKFAHQIAATDHIIATKNTFFLRKPMSLSLTGEEAKRVVQAVSSGKANRELDMSQGPARVRFFQGTNILGEIATDGELFSVDGRRYLALQQAWFDAVFKVKKLEMPVNMGWNEFVHDS